MRPAQDPTAYRRGLVLGLTLAETLLLVLFLLLIVSAALIQIREKRIKEQDDQIAGLSLNVDLGAAKLIDDLVRSGAAGDPKELSLKLSRLSEETARSQQLQRDLETYARLVPTPKAAAAIADAFEQKKMGQSPQAVLDDHIARALAETAPAAASDAQPLTLAEARAAIDRLSLQLDYYRGRYETAAGNGLTYPSCWQRDGRTVYLYDIDLHDTGLTLHARDTRDGLDMSGITAGAEPALEKLLPNAAFLTATQQIYRWSVEQGCRFYVRIADRTSASNKSGYKSARDVVEQRFYIRNLQ